MRARAAPRAAALLVAAVAVAVVERDGAALLCGGAARAAPARAQPVLRAEAARAKDHEKEQRHEAGAHRKEALRGARGARVNGCPCTWKHARAHAKQRTAHRSCVASSALGQCVSCSSASRSPVARQRVRRSTCGATAASAPTAASSAAASAKPLDGTRPAAKHAGASSSGHRYAA